MQNLSTQNIFRYLFVGLLMTGMTVNPASAKQWFHRMGCRPLCKPLPIEICPLVLCCPLVPSCHEPIDISELPTTRPELAAPPEEAATPPEQEVDASESTVVDKSTSVADEAEISPPPVTVPQPAADDLKIPSASESTSEPDIDSLLESPTTPNSEPMPEESSADDSPTTSLFDEPTVSDDQTVEVEALDDLLPPNSDETEAPVDPVLADPVPADPAPENPAPEDPGKTETPSLDDLFGQQQIRPELSEPGGLASRVARWWTDDGAQFRCEARLQQVTAKTVVLVKNNGRRVVVPFSRLSDDDLQFVYRQVVTQREQLAQRAAAEQLASLEAK